MCVPVTRCCFFFPIHGGLYAVGIILICSLVATMTENLIFVIQDNGKHVDLTGENVDYLALVLTGLSLAYLTAIFLNLLMMYGVYKANR